MDSQENGFEALLVLRGIEARFQFSKRGDFHFKDLALIARFCR